MDILTIDQQKVFASYRNGKNIFLCGKGGSGKSFLTRFILEDCKRRGKSVIVCAPTGIAALNVGGNTIHRVFGIPTTIIQKKDRCFKKKKLEVIEKADVIIIDEISMCRIDVFEYMARTLLSFERPKQMLVVGDFYQLPPVLRKEQESAFTAIYGEKRFAFESELWTKLGLITMELQTSMRQTDKAFIKALDNIREGQPDFSVFETGKPEDPTALTICGTNKEADDINKKQLSNLVQAGAKVQKFKAAITGEVESSEYPTDMELNLCVGANVVMLNNDSDKRWVNGSFATVSDVDEDVLQVNIDGNGNIATVERQKWSYYEYVVKEENGEKKLSTMERGTFEQYPVRLAWATTIHKSQGQTYDRVNVNVSSIFAEGQLYVALSRCKTLQGMRIKGNLSSDKIIVSEAVKRFMSEKPSPALRSPMLPFVNDDISLTDGSYTYTQTHPIEEGETTTTRAKHAGGRPRKAPEEKVSSTIIRVPDALTNPIKQIISYWKRNPKSKIHQQLKEFVELKCSSP